MLPIRCFVALTLDGWYAAGVFQGEVLRIRRPHDYNPAAAKALGPTEPSQHMNLALLSVVGGLVDDATAPRISVTGLPAALEEEQVGERLDSPHVRCKCPANHLMSSSWLLTPIEDTDWYLIQLISELPLHSHLGTRPVQSALSLVDTRRSTVQSLSTASITSFLL